MNRRLFLAMTGFLLASPVSMHAPVPVRRIRLLNAHTQESFNGPYRDENGPIGAAMEDLSVLLRDHRSGERTSIDVALIDFLVEVMDAVGVSRAIVLSAFRSLATNEALARTTFGVAENSQHLYGRALDIHLESRLEQAMETARAMKRGGVGWYPRSGFIHIDTGPVRNWTIESRDLDQLLFPVQPIAGDRHRSVRDAKGGLPMQHSRKNLTATRTISPSGERQRLKMQRLLDDLVSHRIE